MTSPDFLGLKKSWDIIEEASVFLSGHNRWATQGSHTDENSHPFNHSNITMFHNGTLTSVASLPNGNRFEVDSEAISYGLSVRPVKEILESIEGAFALVWYDAAKKSLNFARNKERPLWFGKVKGSNSLLYASEKEMLTWLSSRNNIEITEITELPVGKHLEVFLEKDSKVKYREFKPKDKAYSYYDDYEFYKTKPHKKIAYLNKDEDLKKELVGKEINLKASCYSKANGLSGFFGINGRRLEIKITSVSCRAMSKLRQSQLIGKELRVKVHSIISSKGYGIALSEEPSSTSFNKGPGLEKISDSSFNSLIENGCYLCEDPLDSTEDTDIFWTYADKSANKKPVCKECLEAIL